MKKSIVLAVFLVLGFLGFLCSAQAQTSTITWNTTFQTIEGFGAADAFCPNEAGYDTCNLTDAQADLFFSPTAGIGLSILRVDIPTDGSCSATCGFYGLTTMTKAIARGAHVIASPWSPPAAYKSNGTLYCSGGDAGGANGFLNPGSYGVFATYLTHYAQQLQSAHGIGLYALSVQNEPEACTGGTTFEAHYTGAQIHDFVTNNLGSTFAAAAPTKIIIPETVTTTTYGELASKADPCMTDSNCATYIGAVATHDYSYTPTTYTTGNKPLWMDEVSDLNAADPSITSALTYANLLSEWMTDNATMWNYWWLVNGNAGDNEGLIQQDGTITKRFYMMGNWAKFVRPGYVRISASNPTSGVLITAYKDPSSGNFAIVAVNSNSSAAPMTFSFSGFTSGSTVTPWVTSASSNLVAQSPISAGSVFATSLAADSITTFVGGPGGPPPPPPPPPPGGSSDGGTGWSGVISAQRAINWTLTGLPGSNLPDSGWPVCTTIAPYSGTDATITNALAACNTAHPTGGVVALGSGSFTLSSGVMFPINTTGHLALRGAGANATTVTFTGSDCSRGGGFICFTSGDGTYTGNSQSGSTPNVVTVTSGATQGSSQILVGSLGTIVVGSIVVLDQCDTGYTGTGLGTACTGNPNDNGGYFHCQQAWSASSVGCAVYVEGGVNSWRSGSSEMEAASVTAINQAGCGATCLTLSKPIEQPDWGSDTQAVIIQTVPYDGVENMTLVDGKSSIATSDVGVDFFNTYHSWVSGVAAINMGRLGVHLAQSFGGLVKDSYMYGNPIPFGDHAGVRAVGGADNIIQNNICQQVQACDFTADAVPEQADVFAYNFTPATGNGSNSNLINGWQDHGAGSAYQLLEGNVQADYNEDGDHGNHLSQTSFRNLLTGWQSCASQCGGQTQQYGNGDGASAVRLFYGARYGNIVGNVIGTPGWSNTYQAFDEFHNGAIYVWGSGYGPQPTDVLVGSTTLLWGNWDVVNGSTQCNNSEVPTSAPTFPNSIPSLGCGGGTLPPSFYMTVKPSWFGSVPWPVTGPDVSGGNVGQCGGVLNATGHYNGLPATLSSQCANSGLNSTWGGHVNANPAMKCALVTMGMPPDGTGPALPYNPSACYPNGGSVPAAPTGLAAVAH